MRLLALIDSADGARERERENFRCSKVSLCIAMIAMDPIDSTVDMAGFTVAAVSQIVSLCFRD